MHNIGRVEYQRHDIKRHIWQILQVNTLPYRHYTSQATIECWIGIQQDTPCLHDNYCSKTTIVSRPPLPPACACWDVHHISKKHPQNHDWTSPRIQNSMPAPRTATVIILCDLVADKRVIPDFSNSPAHAPSDNWIHTTQPQTAICPSLVGACERLK